MPGRLPHAAELIGEDRAVPRLSSGILLYRRTPELQVLLGHMGGPFWARKDEHAWSIPKGEHGADEDALEAARREFAEEIGVPAPEDLVPLGVVRGTKTLTVWAAEGDLDADAVVSNTFSLEWPPRSGQVQEFPEIDRAAWLDLDTARRKLVRGQLAFLDRLADTLG